MIHSICSCFAWSFVKWSIFGSLLIFLVDFRTIFGPLWSTSTFILIFSTPNYILDGKYVVSFWRENLKKVRYEFGTPLTRPEFMKLAWEHLWSHQRARNVNKNSSVIFALAFKMRRPFHIDASEKEEYKAEAYKTTRKSLLQGFLEITEN